MPPCRTPGPGEARGARAAWPGRGRSSTRRTGPPWATSVPPHGRYGTAGEVASLALFLLSDEAAYVSGSPHLIDGALNAEEYRERQ
ncbi:MAG TPA: SDR family oxidoreductase [Trebonia sp.]|jgi:NAD(P)-dependent dehydrogenase (short-subunit alcohol dehydrogenase family)|nr:SDR family oxidoreductase [Trebonia sp.]